MVHGAWCAWCRVCTTSSFSEENKALLSSTQCLEFKVSEVIITCACSSEASPVPLCPSAKNRVEPLLEGRRL